MLSVWQDKKEQPQGPAAESDEKSDSAFAQKCTPRNESQRGQNFELPAQSQQGCP